MFNFSIDNKNRFLGVDFGTSSIKMVELEYKNGSVFLSNYGWIEIPQRKKIGDFDLKDRGKETELMVALLKRLYEKMNLGAKSAHLSMGSYKGLSALINVNSASLSDLDEIIKLEAGKYIPVSLDEVYLSSDVVSKNKKIKEKTGGEKFINFIENKKEEDNELLEVLLVAAPKEDVHFFEDVVTLSGLKVASFELDVFSATRSLIGDSLGTFLIVDIGAKITNIIFIKKGIIRINRNINIGGDEITKNIASSLNVSWERADEFKKKNDYLKAEGKSIILPIINIIAKESKRVIDLSLNDEEKYSEVEMIIAGGGAGIFGIKDILAETFKGKISIADPWKNIIIENDNIREMASDIAPTYTVATGLALKKILEKK